MRRILVTGATSMIGAALIKKLIENGDNVQKLLGIGWQPKMSFEMGIKEIIKNIVSVQSLVS